MNKMSDKKGVLISCFVLSFICFVVLSQCNINGAEFWILWPSLIALFFVPVLVILVKPKATYKTLLMPVIISIALLVTCKTIPEPNATNKTYEPGDQIIFLNTLKGKILRGSVSPDQNKNQRAFDIEIYSDGKKCKLVHVLGTYIEKE